MLMNSLQNVNNHWNRDIKFIAGFLDIWDTFVKTYEVLLHFNTSGDLFEFLSQTSIYFVQIVIHKFFNC